MSGSGILVCIDGSEYTESTLLHAVWLADHVSAGRIVVVHIADVSKYQFPLVNDLGGGLGVQPNTALYKDVQLQERSFIEALEQQVESVLKDTEFAQKYSFVVGRGNPIDAIFHDDQTIDFVVIGKRGDNFCYDQDQLGSNLYRYLSKCRHPCLIAPRQFTRKDLEKVLFVFSQEQQWMGVFEYLKNFEVQKPCELCLLHDFGSKLPGEIADKIEYFRSAGIRIFVNSVSKIEYSTIVREGLIGNFQLLVLGAATGFRLFGVTLTRTIPGSVVKDCKFPIILCRD